MKRPTAKMKRPTIEEKLATYSMFAGEETIAKRWRDSLLASLQKEGSGMMGEIGSISLSLGSISLAAGAGAGLISGEVGVGSSSEAVAGSRAVGVGSSSAAVTGSRLISGAVGVGSSSVTATMLGEDAGAGVGLDIGSISSVAESGEALTRRKRTPGRWRRIPRILPHPSLRNRPMTLEELLEDHLDMTDEVHCLEQDRPAFRESKAQMARCYQWMIDMEKNGNKPTFRRRVISDTPEQYLTAEEMETQLGDKDVGYQARHFADLAIKHYNNTREDKIELCTVLLSNCFHDSCGSIFAHLNFTARDRFDQKSLYFAELIFDESLQEKRIQRFQDQSLHRIQSFAELNLDGCADDEPMRVISIRNIEDSCCFGGCYEIDRETDDVERCYACSERIKHPCGKEFAGGHDSSRIPYYTAG